MTFIELCKALQQTPNTIIFNDFITLTERNDSFPPSSFDNGTLHNNADENQGSYKLFRFAHKNRFSKKETLACFGEHYQNVLEIPDGDSHQNIRQFILHGWTGIAFHSAGVG